MYIGYQEFFEPQSEYSKEFRQALSGWYYV